MIASYQLVIHINLLLLDFWKGKCIINPEEMQIVVGTIGEVNFDFTCRMRELSFSEIHSDRMVYTPIHTRVGGTGGSFALAARKYFSSVELIGCIGSDSLGNLLENMLQEAGVNTHLLRTRSFSTRTVLLLRDDLGENGLGARLTITTDDSPSYQLTHEYITDVAEVLQRCNVVLFSGYSFLREASRSACLHAVRLCSQYGVAVAVDLVPHNITRVMTLAEVHQLTASAHVLIAELKTVRQLLELPARKEILDLADALECAPVIRQEFPGRWLFLRFGIGNIDQSLVIAPHGEACHTYTNYSELKDPTGFGDELTAKELYILFTKGIKGWTGKTMHFSDV